MVDREPRARTDPRRNTILRRLPQAEYERVTAVGKVVTAELRDEVYSPQSAVEDVYFPLSCVYSYVAAVEEEILVEVGTIGLEGMVGLPAFLGVTHSPHTVFCQVPGSALRLTVPQLRELLVGDGSLHRLLNRYVQALMVQIAQNVACNRTHATDERAARWLLTTQDRVGEETFPLTQEFLAQMLGVRRPTVSVTARRLQSAGLISYSRGTVTIIDRGRLTEAACDCYAIVRDETRRLMGAAPD
jgi:CRP-like cAMP-binding protein